MFAYCNNNPTVYIDSLGTAAQRYPSHTLQDYRDFGGCRPNIDVLMAYFGVSDPSEVPDIPEGALIFIENITSVSGAKGFGIVRGKTLVLNEYKYCEYTFWGIGGSISKSIPLDVVITQGLVYGVDNVTDYCGLFFGGAYNMLSSISGGAYASPQVYAKIKGGMSYAPSLGLSATYYWTQQSNWIYGKAPFTIVANPYQSVTSTHGPHL